MAVKLSYPNEEEAIAIDLGFFAEISDFAKACSRFGTIKSLVLKPTSYLASSNEKENKCEMVLGERTIRNELTGYLGVVPVIRLDDLTNEERVSLKRYIKMCQEEGSSIYIGEFYQDIKHLDDLEKENSCGSEELTSLFSKQPIEWIYYKPTQSLVATKVLKPYTKYSEREIFCDVELRKEIEKGFGQIFEEYKTKTYSEEDLGYINGSNHGINTIERIEKFIESDMPVFLHGKPGEGKSQRVKQIDPNCTTLELSLIPIEELAGIVICNNNEAKKIKPEWLTNIEKLCEREPDKTHILFLDELTNALPTIQQLAYSLVLERRVANTWKLPSNVRIVAAGNEVEDSNVATEMPKPLSDRFAHINVKTSLEEWIEWAKDSKIHPAIISYIAYRGESALRKKADRIDGIGITPRTWERASKQLKVTNDITSLIPIIGVNQVAQFRSFCKIVSITKEKIIKGVVDEKLMLKLDVGLKTAIVNNLTNASYEEYPIIREFVRKGGSEITALLDSLWISKDEKGSTSRAERVMELKMDEKMEEEIVEENIGGLL